MATEMEKKSGTMVQAHEFITQIGQTKKQRRSGLIYVPDYQL